MTSELSVNDMPTHEVHVSALADDSHTCDLEPKCNHEIRANMFACTTGKLTAALTECSCDMNPSHKNLS